MILIRSCGLDTARRTCPARGGCRTLTHSRCIVRLQCAFFSALFGSQDCVAAARSQQKRARHTYATQQASSQLAWTGWELSVPINLGVTTPVCQDKVLVAGDPLLPGGCFNEASGSASSCSSAGVLVAPPIFGTRS